MLGENRYMQAYELLPGAVEGNAAAAIETGLDLFELFGRPLVASSGFFRYQNEVKARMYTPYIVSYVLL